MSIAAPLNEHGPSADCGVVLHGVPWSTYLELRDAPENYNLRMTYRRGDLKIMSPSYQHERIAKLLGSLIDIWTMEFRVPRLCCGNLTIRRKDLDLGFEPDNCYYVQSRPTVSEDEEIDFQNEPPPDLAIEVDKSRSSESKMQLYQSFRVPELWRIVCREIRIFALDPQGSYQPRESSLAFPGFPIKRVNEILMQYSSDDELNTLCSFRDWVRENANLGGE